MNYKTLLKFLLLLTFMLALPALANDPLNTGTLKKDVQQIASDGYGIFSWAFTIIGFVITGTNLISWKSAQPAQKGEYMKGMLVGIALMILTFLVNVGIGSFNNGNNQQISEEAFKVSAVIHNSGNNQLVS